MSNSARKKGRWVPTSASAADRSGAAKTPPGQSTQAKRPGQAHRKKRGLGLGTKVTLLAGLAIVALAVIYFANNVFSSTPSASGSTTAYPYQIGVPGRESAAPPIQLASTGGGSWNLASQRGKTVLLFFEEGVGCEPCWTQIKDIEKNWKQFHALGIDEIVTITTNTLSQLQQKVADEGIHSLVLADPTMSASLAYTANKYGMMGDQMDGHTFMVVGKDGLIKWRADYGGAPKYIMYLPVPALIHDIRKGLNGRAA